MKNNTLLYIKKKRGLKIYSIVKLNLNKLPVVFQLFLQSLDALVEVLGVGLVVLLCLQVLRFLLLQIPLQGPEAQRQRFVVFLGLPLQVQPILGQTLRLCKKSLKE